MSALFEELDYRPTSIGALSLRRRRDLKLGVDVYEIKLGDEFLMSSLFTASEIALARRLGDGPGAVFRDGQERDFDLGGQGGDEQRSEREQERFHGANGRRAGPAGCHPSPIPLPGANGKAPGRPGSPGFRAFPGVENPTGSP